MIIETPKDPKFKRIYEKHCKLLKLNGLQPKTVDAYSRAIRCIGQHFDYGLYHLSFDQLTDYFTNLLESHSWSAVKLDLYGLKFFFTHVLKKEWVDIPMVNAPKTSRIPDILTIKQLQTLFMATNRLSYRVYFYVSYSMGLRLGESLNLQVGDIDPSKMKVHIREAKGNKDRLVPLPHNTLNVLRNFWRVHRHPGFIFPNRKRGLKNSHLVESHLDRGGVQSAMKKVVTELGIKKRLPAIHCATVLLPIQVFLIDL